MSNDISPSNVKNDTLLFLYKSILLAWESEYSDQTFKVDIGNYRKYCTDNDIEIIQLQKIDDMQDQYEDRFAINRNKCGLLIFHNSSGYKVQGLFRNLRNAIAHAAYKKRQFNKMQCIYFENWKDKKLRFIGFVPELYLRTFIKAIISAKV